jgi:glycosyltransferase involved in cell wall biosynthesis
MMRSLEVLCHIDLRHGGVVAAVPRMAATLRVLRACDARVLSFARPGERQEGGLDSNLLVLPHDAVQALFSHRKEIARAVERARVVHVHGLWHPALLFTAGLALRMKRPLIVSPHGMLDSWALGQNAWKKRLASSLLQRRLLSAASCIRALTAAEAADCDRYTRFGRIEVIPNGVPEPSATAPPGSFPGVEPGQRVITFLGRLHRKKGLEMLLKTWEELATTYQDAVLILAGPDEQGLACGPLPQRCRWVGSVDSVQKWRLLAASSLFVLPSFSEGFSIAVLEAMASGCPVVISRACNFPEVESTGSGLVIEPNGAALHEALKYALGKDAATLRAWGERGKQVVASRFSESVIASRIAALYASVYDQPIPSELKYAAS